MTGRPNVDMRMPCHSARRISAGRGHRCAQCGYHPNLRCACHLPAGPYRRYEWRTWGYTDIAEAVASPERVADVRVAAFAVFRRRRFEAVLVAVVTAVLVGGALAAAAGARRSSTAIDRFLAFSPTEDVFVVPPEDGSLDVDAVNHLPQVAVAAYQSYIAMVPVGPDGAPQLASAGTINPFLYAPIVGPPDGIGRRKVIKGR